MFTKTSSFEIRLHGSRLTLAEILRHFHTRWFERYDRSWMLVAPEVRFDDGVFWAECAEQDDDDIVDILEDVLSGA